MTAAEKIVDAETGSVIYRSGEIESLFACEFCGVAIVPLGPWQRTCGSERCRDRLRLLDPKRVAYARAKNRRWCEEHRAVRNRQPWLFGPPPHGPYLPGGGCEIAIAPPPQWPIEHRNVRALHGMLTAVMQSQHGQWPAFSILPWPRGCGWAVYSRVDEELARVAGQRVRCRLFDREVDATFGPLARMKAPVVTRRSRQRVRVDAITPVIVRSMSGTTIYTAPTAELLRSTLTQEFPGRLGVEIGDDDLRLELVERDTQPATVLLGGKYGAVRGWTGSIVLDVNAVGRWLIEAAARGPGLGGRVSFGFGRIRVSEA